MAYDAVVAGYDKTVFDDGRWKRTVYRKGSGPAVIIIHEMPGLHPGVVAFADRVAEAGMTVFLPVMFVFSPIMTLIVLAVAALIVTWLILMLPIYRKRATAVLAQIGLHRGWGGTLDVASWSLRHRSIGQPR